VTPLYTILLSNNFKSEPIIEKYFTHNQQHMTENFEPRLPRTIGKLGQIRAEFGQIRAEFVNFTFLSLALCVFTSFRFLYRPTRFGSTP